MIQQALDFRAESDVLFGLLDPLLDQEWERKTQFKEWTMHDVVAHLHFGNYLADLSLRDSDAFTAFLRRWMEEIKQRGTNRAATNAWLDGTKNRALLQRWREFYQEMTERFLVADPKKRVKWAGPDMSVRSSISARLMETWAHGQAVYDLLGQERHDGDRIQNIAVLGVNTFGWTFTNRGQAVPTDPPYLRLTAPSGAIWEWNLPAQSENRIEGKAAEFCQVVTQVRNIADTTLQVTGVTATAWMAVAQCFAGPPENPPVPGKRFRQ